MDVLKLHPCEALFGQHRRRRGRTRLVEALINWAPLGKALSRLFATLSSLFLLHLPSLLSFSFVYVLSPLVVVFVPNSFFFFAVAFTKQLLLFYTDCTGWFRNDMSIFWENWEYIFENKTFESIFRI